jgi:predicted lipid-binding transport protein (Tim44 family)
VCDAPCDVDVPIDGTYRMRMTGENAPSLPFELRVLPGWSHLDLKVDTGPRAARRAGTTVIVLGVVGILGGGLVAGQAGSAQSLGGGFGALLLGGALAGGGLICVAVGLVLRAANSEEETVTQSAASAGHLVRSAWRVPEPTNRAAPQPLDVPSLHFSF